MRCGVRFCRESNFFSALENERRRRKSNWRVSAQVRFPGPYIGGTSEIFAPLLGNFTLRGTTSGSLYVALFNETPTPNSTFAATLIRRTKNRLRRHRATGAVKPRGNG